MFSDAYVAGRSSAALRRAVLGFNSALQICPTEAEMPLFNQQLLDALCSNLSPESHNAFVDGLETFAYELLNRAQAARSDGSDVVEAPAIEIGDVQARDAFYIFNMDHVATLEQVPVVHYAMEAILVSVASTFEAFCNQIICTLFLRHPQSMSGDLKISFDLALKSSDLQELVLRTCESEARAKISGPVDAWLRYMRERVGLPLPKKLKDWPTAWLNVCRIFAMRNCLVHRGGVVDSTFVDSMSRYGLPVGKEGDRLYMSPSSIHNGIHSACSVVTDLYAMAEITQASRDRRACTVDRTMQTITEIQWYLIGRGQHQLAMHMDCTKKMNTDWATIHHVSSWTARYLCGEVDQVKREIANVQWHDSAYFQLHRAALAGEKAEVQRAVRDAVNAGNVSTLGIAHSPHFSVVKTFLDTPSPDPE